MGEGHVLHTPEGVTLLRGEYDIGSKVMAGAALIRILMICMLAINTEDSGQMVRDTLSLKR